MNWRGSMCSRRRGRWLRAACACLLLAPALAGAAPLDVALVGDFDDARIVRVADALEQALADGCPAPCSGQPRVSRHAPAGVDSSAAASADLLVAIGSQAGREVALAAPDAATLYTFLPQAAWDELAACCVDQTRPHSALFIDQPLPRKFALIRQLVPDAARVAVLLGEVSAERRAALRRAATQAGYALNTADINDPDEIGSSLRRLVRDVDVLLALPDPRVYNRNTAYPILLTTYSARVPVIGFSDAMVRAGAAAAVFATPEDVGREIARHVHDYQRSGTLPPPGFGREFSISVNDAVIRSLRLPDQTAADLKHRLQERKP
ncbi:MAG: hypothetical protein KDI82_06560 [Gammaproteobacteria bacterium]|nr:hypothetical protein [Gammaproteobacteria bacterium]